jgi:hypothetical protein
MKVKINKDYIFFNLLFFIAFYYASYRYPLAINSTSTSPTYMDTPFLFKVAKYIAVLLLVGLYMFMSFLAQRKNLRINNFFLVYLSLYIFLFIYPVISTILFFGSESVAPQLIETGFYFLIPIVMLLFANQINIEILFKSLKWFLYLALFVNFIQVILFFIFGRLPALAYENSIAVRFGSIWDDPNGFAIFLSFLIPFGFIVTNGFSKIKRIIIILGLLISLMVTQSLTGIIGVLMTLIFGNILLLLLSNRTKYAKFIVKIIILFIIIGLILYNIDYIYNFIQQFMLMKQGSIEAHEKMFDVFKYLSFSVLIGVEPTGILSESGWFNIVFNFGILYTLTYLFVTVRAIIIYGNIILKRQNSNEELAIATGAFFFLICVTISSFNLPVAIMFPVNLLMILFISLSHIIKIFPRNEI